MVGDVELPLWAEYQDQDVGDLIADEVDQQQVAQRLLGGAEFGIGRNLDHVRFGAIAPGAPGEQEPVGELGGQDQLGRRRLPADQVGDSAKAENGVAVVLNEPLGALVLVLLPGRFGHGPLRSRVTVTASDAAQSALNSTARSLS